MTSHDRALAEKKVTVKTAKDIMQTHVVSVGSDDPLASVYRLFADEEISGAPVVDESGTVVGVVSIRDLVRTTREDHERSFFDSNYLRDGLFNAQVDRLTSGEDFEETLTPRTVSEVMTTSVVAVTPDTPTSEIVKTILRDRVHRVLVVERQKGKATLVGLISLLDLVALLASDECHG